MRRVSACRAKSNKEFKRLDMTSERSPTAATPQPMHFRRFLAPLNASIPRRHVDHQLIQLHAEERRGAEVEVRFYNDPTTDLPQIYEHGVTAEEVTEVLLDIGEDLPAKRGSRMKLGQTSAGRYL